MARSLADHKKLIAAFVPEWMKHPNVPSVAPKTIDKFEALLAQGVDMSASDNSGQTVLRLVAGYGKAELAKWLVEHGANPRAVDRANQTPREHAEERLKFFREGDDPVCPTWPMRIPGFEQTIAVLKEAERKSPGKRGKPPKPPQPKILKVPVAKRRGLCATGFDTAQQLMIHADIEDVARWFESQLNVERVERDVTKRATLPLPLGPVIGLVQLAGHSWTYISGAVVEGAEPMTKWSAQMHAPVLQAGTEDTSGVAYYFLFRGGKLVEEFESDGGAFADPPDDELTRFRSTLRKAKTVGWSNYGSEWAFIEAFLKSQDAYLTFAGVWFDRKTNAATVRTYYPDESLPKHVRRADLVYLASSRVGVR